MRTITLASTHDRRRNDRLGAKSSRPAPGCHFAKNFERSRHPARTLRRIPQGIVSILHATIGRLLVNESYRALRDELSKVIFGQDEVIDFALAALFSCGHVILEGPPGVAKTLMVRTLAATLDLSHRRIQMT